MLEKILKKNKRKKKGRKGNKITISSIKKYCKERKK